MNTAIITGASAGIGSATAELFIERGYRVINLSRRPCQVSGVTNVSCDLANEDRINAVTRELVAEIKDANGVTSLVHNACQMRKDSVADCTSASLRAVMETNLIAANTLNQQLLPAFNHGSSIIYVGSTLSEKAVSNSFSYVISKHALLGMMRATCQDLMGSGIHTACVCPGFTDTEMLREHLGNDLDLMQQIGGANGFGRLVTAAEIAELIEWAHTHPVLNGAVLHGNLGQMEN